MFRIWSIIVTFCSLPLFDHKHLFLPALKGKEIQSNLRNTNQFKLSKSLDN